MKTKSKTFAKGDEFHDMHEWFVQQIETDDWQPEGTDWSGGEPGPLDPRCDLKFKYRIIIQKIED